MLIRTKLHVCSDNILFCLLVGEKRCESTSGAVFERRTKKSEKKVFCTWSNFRCFLCSMPPFSSKFISLLHHNFSWKIHLWRTFLPVLWSCILDVMMVLHHCKGTTYFLRKKKLSKSNFCTWTEQHDWKVGVLHKNSSSSNFEGDSSCFLFFLLYKTSAAADKITF